MMRRIQPPSNWRIPLNSALAPVYSKRKFASTLSPFIPTIRSVLQDFTQSNKTESVTICGWVRSVRNQKTIAFLEVDDGTTLNGLQAVVTNPALAQSIHTGSSVKLTGHLTSVPSRKQSIELQVSGLELVGSVDPNTYPLHKARVSLDHLRMHQEFRSRSRLFGAIWRIRDAVVHASHSYFRNLDFIQVTTPVLTSHDCEGGGEVFQITTTQDKSEQKEHSTSNASASFFGRPVYTTVSGQLHLEILASAISRVYTLGPTFRAEPSDSARHLAEFWMLEAEMSFIDSLEEQLIPLIQGYVQHVIKSLLENSLIRDDLTLLNQFVDQSLLERLESLVSHDKPFAIMTYSDAVNKLNAEAAQASKRNKSTATITVSPVKWGDGLSYEQERYLAEEIIQGPVFITHYPRSIKPFYMKASSSDTSTVACTDLLVPKWGELVGGSLREDDPNRLVAFMKEKMGDHSDAAEEYDWYLRLRQYGSVPHGGFGIGLERLLGLVTGMKNVRDLIPFPRAKAQCRF